jgi:hypothetical protein
MVISSVESEESEPEGEDIITVCELGPCPTFPEAANVESAPPVSNRQSPRVWPPTRWGEWTYGVAGSRDDDDDDEPRIEDLVTRGGRKVG